MGGISPECYFIGHYSVEKRWLANGKVKELIRKEKRK
jgi:hypothetical protein